MRIRVSELPDTVQKAWGPEVARDFVAWLDEYLQGAQLASEVQVSAFVARQKVNVLVLERVSNLLLAGEPKLVQQTDACPGSAGERWVWRVPAEDVAHAVVIVGVEEGRHFWINDPAKQQAPLAVSWGGLLAAWAEFDYRGAALSLRQEEEQHSEQGL